jgi:hypothetical protein
MTYFPVTAPYNIFTDTDGEPLEDGYIYIGEANQNPITNPITVTWDVAGLYPAAQPIRTIGGYPDRNGSPSNIYVNAGAFQDYSILVKEKSLRRVYYSRSVRFDLIANANSIDKIDDLRNIVGYNQPIYVRGHTTLSDGGHGNFEWFEGAAPGTYVDDNGCTIVPTGGDGSGAWIRQYNGPVRVKFFGAVGDEIIDDYNAIQSALDKVSAGQVLILDPGKYRISAELVLGDQCGIVGASGYDNSTIVADSGVNCIRITPTTGSFTKHQSIRGVTFRSSGTGSTGIIGSTLYTYTFVLEDCHFDASLETGASANFIELRSTNNFWGYYGGLINMVNGLECNGIATTSEANHNIITGDVFSNLTGDAIVVTEGWGLQLIGATVDNIDGYAISATGGFTISIVGGWFERCGNGTTKTGIFELVSGTSGIFVFNMNGGIIQVNTTQNNKIFEDAGSRVINLTSVSFAGLATGSFSIGNNPARVVLNDTCYYPGGFSDIDYNKIIPDLGSSYRSFNEIDDDTGSTDYYTKILKHDNATFSGSILGLHAKKAASGTYNFLRARADIDGSPITMHTLAGNGTAYHGSSVTIADGTWNGGHLILGTYHLWVDATGDLRINNGAPGGDFSGVVVGTQT